MTAIPPEAANVLAMILHKAETGGTPGGAPTTDTTAPTNTVAASPTGTLPQGGGLDDTLARTNAEGQGIINRASQAGSQTADTSTVTDIPAPVNTTTPTPGADAVGLVNPRVSQGYGGSSGHPGVDLGIPSGTPLVAAESGKVTAAGNTDPGGYGNEVEITAANGVVMRYGHLSQVGVKLGDTVAAGSPIGKSGGDPGDPNKGNARGAHLHFEVRVGGHTVDPLPYLAGGAGVVAGTSTGNPAAQVATTTETTPVVEPANVAQNILDVASGKQPTNQTQTTVTKTPVPGQPQTGATGDSDPGAVDAFLGAIRQHESGGNYQIRNTSGQSNAAGAYQFIGSTWRGLGGSTASAADASPAEQDAIARAYATSLFNEFHSWRLAAIAWYGGPGIAQQAARGVDVGSPQGQGPYAAYGDTIERMMQGGK